MKGHHVLLGAMAKMLSRVGDEEIGKVYVLTITVLPLDNTADIYSSILIVEWLTKEAEIARSQHAIDLVVASHEG
jgi:hypothetical protein